MICICYKWITNYHYAFSSNKSCIMSESSVHQMRIFELRNKLKEVGLSSSGTKAELISRLSQYYEDQKKQEEVAVGEDLVKTEEIVENAQTEGLGLKTSSLYRVECEGRYPSY